MTDAAKAQRATVADLLAIPEEHRRHEIIDGVLVEKEAASGRHGGAQVRIADRDERVRAEPFDAIELRVAVLFGDDDGAAVRARRGAGPGGRGRRASRGRSRGSAGP